MPPSANPRRVACVDVPALPLQLVLRAHPDWQNDPVVLVEDDRPQARIVWANRHARAARIVRGQRCQDAEALASRLHTAVVPAADLDRASTELLRLLLDYSPVVEPVRTEPGLFFVDANGLHELFSGLEAWAHALHGALGRRGFTAAVVVGFVRFATFAIARSRPGWRLLGSPDEEQELAAKAPFALLDGSPKLREQMQALGIRTLGDFLRLPAGELGRRFGKEAKELLLRATAGSPPLTPARLCEPLRFRHDFDIADADLERFLAVLSDGLHDAVPKLMERGEAIAALCVTLQLERAPVRHERLATAAPTLDLAQILELVRLRFAKEQLAGPIEHLAVEIDSVTVPRQQLALLTVRRRDLAAGARALARLEAALGDAAVTRARLVPSHLPEHSFVWEPTGTLAAPRAATATDRTAATTLPLVRTFVRTPEPLGTMPAHEPEAWLGDYGAVQRAHGPFRTSNGWWRQRTERDYFFLETDRGAILWVFHDRGSRRWYLHGRVD
ncbi:MAG TPA: DNA polymerase Y family protein [Planctomycetota bacterium]|nr:DNA polymerase Y family protein [Planctomycetota bacterium]